MLDTEYSFVLPKGYVDPDGDVHREGAMRLARGADEIVPLKDPRVRANPAYLVFILMARVVTRLGSVEVITPKVMEELFASDLAFLQEMYQRINFADTGTARLACPRCGWTVDDVAAPTDDARE